MYERVCVRACKEIELNSNKHSDTDVCSSCFLQQLHHNKTHAFNSYQFISFHLIRSTITHIVHITISLYSKARENISYYAYFAEIPYGCLPFDLHHLLSAVYGWVHFLFLSFRFIEFSPIFFLHSVMAKESVITLCEQERKKKKWNEPHIIEMNRLEIFLWIFLFRSKHLYKC